MFLNTLKKNHVTVFENVGWYSCHWTLNMSSTGTKWNSSVECAVEKGLLEITNWLRTAPVWFKLQSVRRTRQRWRGIEITFWERATTAAEVLSANVDQFMLQSAGSKSQHKGLSTAGGGMIVDATRRRRWVCAGNYSHPRKCWRVAGDVNQPFIFSILYLSSFHL